jgi:hypothetical protein
VSAARRTSRGLVLVLVVAAVVLGGGPFVVGSASADPAPGGTFTLPDRVTAPGPVTGTPTVTGPQAGRVNVPSSSRFPGGPGFMGAVTGVQLSYEGTCSALEWLGTKWQAIEGGNCDAGLAAITDWLGFGSSGDDRGFVQLGGGTPVVNSGCSAAYGPTGITPWQTNPGPNALVCTQLGPVTFPNGGGYGIYLTCKNATTGEVASGWQYTYRRTTSGSQSINSVSPFGCNTGGDISGNPWASWGIGTNVITTGIQLVAWLTANSGPVTGAVPTAAQEAAAANAGQWVSDPGQNWGGPGTSSTGTITCRAPSGATVDIEFDIPLFTPLPDGSAPEIEYPSCNDELPGSSRIKTTIETGRSGAPEPEVTVEMPVWDPTVENTYPLCLTQTCTLEIFKDNESCWAGGQCQGLGTEADPSGAGYTCRWGPYAVSWAWCSASYDVADAFDEQPTPTPTSAPTPTPSPTGAPEPPGENEGCPEGANPLSESCGGDPDGEENCWAGAISWNPVDWVTTPVKCALMWAFVPSDGFLSGTIDGFGTSWGDSIVGDWFGGIALIVDEFPTPDGDGCLGPPLTVSLALLGGGSHTLYPFTACEQPMATIATIVRASLVASMFAAVGFFSLKTIFAAFGWMLPAGWGGRDVKP